MEKRIIFGLPEKGKKVMDYQETIRDYYNRLHEAILLNRMETR